MDNIVVIGGGGHAKVVISMILKSKNYNLIGYTDNIDKGSILDAPYLGTDEILEYLYNEKGVNFAACGIGKVIINDFRSDLIKRICGIGYFFPSIISPNAIINNEVHIGQGSVIMDGVIVNSSSMIGNYCILNTRASIDHDCIIEDGVHIAPGVVLCGGVKVEKESIIGAGSVVIQNRKICNNVLVGAGSVVSKDIAISGTYYGVSAKKVK